MDVYENRIKEEINALSDKKLYLKIDEILNQTDNLSSEIINILLCYACSTTNDRLIAIGRNCLCQFPVDWITNKIMKLVFKSINIYDDWDYRRFLELSEMISNELLEWAISISNHSNDAEIIEAVDDFKEHLRKNNN